MRFVRSSSVANSVEQMVDLLEDKNGNILDMIEDNEEVEG